jgi:hypothetical protein
MDFDRKTRGDVGTKIFNRKSKVAPKNMVSLAKLLKTCQRISKKYKNMRPEKISTPH